MNKLDIKSFESKMESRWLGHLSPFLESGECYNIFQKLKVEKREKFPSSSYTFEAFKQTPFDKLKCVFVGLSPYWTKIRGENAADGLVFSCSTTRVEQPSLKLIYDALETPLEEDKRNMVYRDPSLKRWANEGVLLLNCALTTIANDAKSHVPLWNPFMEFLFNNVFDKVSGIPFVFFGQVAAELEPLVSPIANYSKIVEHPSYAARQKRAWNDDGLFDWVNDILEKNNGKDYRIPFIEYLPF